LTQVVPVNSNILKWARETSGLSIAQVAKRLKKTTGVIEEWEQGVSFPTYPQLEKLAYEIYKRPTAVFFFPAIPQESSPRAEFRTLPEEVVDTIPPEIIKLYRKAKIYQLNLQELDNKNEVKISSLLDNYELTKTSNLSNLSESIRGFLKINLQMQISWKNCDEAIKAWRNALIAYGIYIFKDAFYNDHYSGISLYDKNYPVILINNSMPVSRQIFTIFHELGHLLFKAGGVYNLDESFHDRLHSDYYILEQKCNEFAGEFLLPSAIFQANIPAFSEKSLNELADMYKVSREVVLRKYLNNNLITAETYKIYTRKWFAEYLESRKKKKEDTSGGNPYYTRISYLGEYYINLVYSHYYQGKIDTTTLADYLDIKAGNVSAFEEHFLR